MRASEQTINSPSTTLQYRDRFSTFLAPLPGLHCAANTPMAIPTPALVNRLIANLPPKESNRLLQHSESVDLIFGDVLYEPYQPLRYVYFPLSSLISLLAKADGHQPLEMGLIGNEGMFGPMLVLDIDASTMQGVVQGTGKALRITVSQFRRDLADSPVLLRTLKRYLYILMAQLSQATVCIHFHQLEPRLARWLLMMHDRTITDQFHLTHEFLAGMLGVRRSGITVAAGALQKKKLIHYSRGEIRILNRKGLEAASCECYSVMVDDYERLLN